MTGCGLISFHNSALYSIRYALDKGYIPVIDYQNYKNIYLTEDKFGKENSWEYYFDQPSGYNIEDINKAYYCAGSGCRTCCDTN